MVGDCAQGKKLMDHDGFAQGDVVVSERNLWLRAMKENFFGSVRRTGEK